MYAIVKTGSKQYKVQKGDVIEVESLDVEPGKSVELDVVMLADGDKLVVDAKSLEKKKASAKVLEHKRGDKIVVFKMHKRKRYQRTQGHRQNLTCLEISSLPALS